MILASQSPRRRELLEQAGFALTVAPADIDETRREAESPVELVGRLARQKARAVLSRLLDGTDGARALVAADTIVWDDDGEVLGKPADDADAARMLRELSGRTHHVSTGACLLAPDQAVAGGARETYFVETTDVTFWELTETEVAAYVASGEPRDKAGAYGIQGAGRLLVRSIRGDYQNVVGLPVSRLVRELGSLIGEKDLVARAIEKGGPLA
ncbi:septum formation protein Maf [Olsenella profusa]|uniref:dTTP/UTP pyrophosphatase n=1 Tax=Olsenella profusa TaxID=138595 RepID=A0ABS2F0J7_9ACTN|nr:Maf family protein [Olsenella profusa]MBM6774064.1 septum formation protein Maf [Olsenella profusa]